MARRLPSLGEERRAAKQSLRFAAVPQTLGGMKQHLKFIALFAVLMAGALGVVAYLGRGARSVGDQVMKTSMGTEARILLIAMRTELDVRRARAGRFPARLTLDDTNGVTRQRYSAGVVNPDDEIDLWWGEPELREAARALCPDCRINEDGYKLIALGNLDEDPDLDVWIITNTMDKPERIRAD